MWAWRPAPQGFEVTDLCCCVAQSTQLNGAVGVLCGWRAVRACGPGVWLDPPGGGIAHGSAITAATDDERLGGSDKSISSPNEGGMVTWLDSLIWPPTLVARVAAHVECDHNSCKEEQDDQRGDHPSLPAIAGSWGCFQVRAHCVVVSACDRARAHVSHT